MRSSVTNEIIDPPGIRKKKTRGKTKTNITNQKGLTSVTDTFCFSKSRHNLRRSFSDGRRDHSSNSRSVKVLSSVPVHPSDIGRERPCVVRGVGTTTTTVSSDSPGRGHHSHLWSTPRTRKESRLSHRRCEGVVTPPEPPGRLSTLKLVTGRPCSSADGTTVTLGPPFVMTLRRREDDPLCGHSRS